MIESIRLVGCQSWEDTTIHLLGDKANIIVAPNNVGKSVLFKMLKITACPKFYSAKKRKKLIRWGFDHAMVIYGFDNGDVGCTAVYPTTVIYLYRRSGEKEFTKAYEPMPEFIENLGIIVNKDGNFIANVIDTDQNLLLVDSEAKATYEFVNMMCNSAEIEELKVKLEEEKKSIFYSRSRTDSRLSDLNSQISQMKYVDIYELQRSLDAMVCVKNVLYDSILLSSVLGSIADKIRYYRDYDTLLRAVGIAITLEQIDFQSCNVKKFDNNLLSVCDTLQRLNTIDFSKVVVGKEPPSRRLADVAALLESVSFEKCYCKEKPISAGFIDALESAESARDGFTKYLEALKLATESSHSCDALEKQFIESGDSYNCSIYGKVIFDGQKCVPYSA